MSITQIFFTIREGGVVGFFKSKQGTLHSVIKNIGNLCDNIIIVYLFGVHIVDVLLYKPRLIATAI